MKPHWKQIVVAAAVAAAATSHAADIALNSACDFSAMSLTLIDEANPDTVSLNATLQSPARARLEAASRAALHQTLTVSIDEITVSSVTVQEVITTPEIQFNMPRATARKLVPSLLDTQCGADRPPR